MGPEKGDTRGLERLEDLSTISTVGSHDSGKIEPYPIPTDTLTLPGPPPSQDGEDSGSDEGNATMGSRVP